MKIFAVENEDGEDGFLFTSREAALAYGGSDAVVNELTVYDDQPPTWTYWSRGASVYPDGVVDDWTTEHTARGEISIQPVDDHLNRRADPWHSYGNCGEHVCIHGTDRDGVEAAYQDVLALALARQNGKCQAPSCDHSGDIDGANIYNAGFLSVRLRGEREPFRMDCYRYFEHDWKHERPDFASCTRCSCCLVSYSVNFTLTSTSDPEP